MRGLLCKVKSTVSNDIEDIKYAKSTLNTRQILIVITIISAIACVIYKFIDRFRTYKGFYDIMDEVNKVAMEHPTELKLDEEELNLDDEEE